MCNRVTWKYDETQKVCSGSAPYEEGPPSPFHRAMSGGLAGVLAGHFGFLIFGATEVKRMSSIMHSHTTEKS